MGGKKLQNGLNFAYGGSGVFNTIGDLLPNMSTQIGFYDKLVHDSVYTKSDLKSSLVLVCLSGNDYGAFLAQGGTMQVTLPSSHFTSLEIGIQDFLVCVLDLIYSIKNLYILLAINLLKQKNKLRDSFLIIKWEVVGCESIWIIHVLFQNGWWSVGFPFHFVEKIWYYKFYSHLYL